MNAGNIKNIFNKLQPALRRLSWFGKKDPKATKSARRAYKFSIQLTYTRAVHVTVRKFNTKKTSRAKKQKQFIITTGFLPFKEVVVIYKQSRPKAKIKYLKAFAKSRAASTLIVLTGLVGAFLFGINVNRPSALEPVPNIAVAPHSKVTANTLPYSPPVKLSIPSLGLNTQLITLGQTSDGSMEVPTDVSQAGWYKLSPTPGQLGPSVIVGHVDDYHGPGVFFKLKELTPQDTIQVTRVDGKTVEFRVDKVEIYPKSNFPTTAVYGNINYAGIRLITCGGVFDKQAGDYDSNVVVYGSLL